MKQTIKKKLNLNKLKAGCLPCLAEVKKMEYKISGRDFTKIKIL